MKRFILRARISIESFLSAVIPRYGSLDSAIQRNGFNRLLLSVSV